MLVSSIRLASLIEPNRASELELGYQTLNEPSSSSSLQQLKRARAELGGLCPSIINHVIIHGFYALDSKLPSFSLPLDLQFLSVCGCNLQFLSVCGCNFCPIYLSISNLSLSVPILSVVPIFSVVPISRGSDLLCGSDLPNPSFYLSIWNFSLSVPIFSVRSSQLPQFDYSVDGIGRGLRSKVSSSSSFAFFTAFHQGWILFNGSDSLLLLRVTGMFYHGKLVIQEEELHHTQNAFQDAFKRLFLFVQMGMNVGAFHF
ncbi:hypothetical protein LXL04_025042 [Taraxacum kok-saghyz]